MYHFTFKIQYFKCLDAFKVHDFDGDGRLSVQDLISYLELVVDFGDMQFEEVYAVRETKTIILPNMSF